MKLKITVAILSTLITAWAVLTIIAIRLTFHLTKKGIITVNFDTRKKADVLIDELDKEMKKRGIK